MRCETCHAGAACSWGIFRGAKEGWWTYRELDLLNSTDGGLGTIVRGVELYQECKPIHGFNSSRCLGGPSSECIPGHWGPLCSLCERFHYKGFDRCLPCEGNGTGSVRDQSSK